MSSLTIGLTQLKRKKRNDGTIPVYIRFTEDRKSRYKSTGIAIKAKHWLGKTDNWVSTSIGKSTSQRYNRKLRNMLNEVRDVEEQLYKKERLSLDTIMDALSEDETDTRSILHQAKAYKEHLKKDDRYWEQRHFTVIINNLESFISGNGKSDRLDQLDADWIEDWQDWLLNDVGNGNNTVRKKLQRLKGLTDWLYDNGEIKSNPYERVDRVESKRTNNKIKLSFQQIEAIKNLKLQSGSDLWHTRNYFMFSFYNAGIRFGDLCCLKWKNLIDGRLIYRMNKTDQQKSINQLQPMYGILIQYAKIGEYVTFTQWQPTLQRPVDPIDSCLKYIVIAYAQKHGNDYMFPILDENYSDPQKLRAKISSKNVIVNRHLKTLADKAGIQANVSFHVSRHSFAHYALKKGMDLYAISKALGHSGLKVTEEYIKTFDEELLDKSMKNLF